MDKNNETVEELETVVSDNSTEKKEKKSSKRDKELIEKLKQDVKELTDKNLLSHAELVNYRKRKDEEMINTIKYANQDIIKDLIPLVDNFDRAVSVTNKSDEVNKFLDGFKIMHSALKDILKKYGVEEINRVGEVFDPMQEEALMTENNPDMDDDIVIEVLLKGYKLKDRVIRPASVKINQQ